VKSIEDGKNIHGRGDISDARARRGPRDGKEEGRKEVWHGSPSIVRRARGGGGGGGGGGGSRRAFACQDWSMQHPNLCIRGEMYVH